MMLVQLEDETDEVLTQEVGKKQRPKKWRRAREGAKEVCIEMYERAEWSKQIVADMRQVTKASCWGEFGKVQGHESRVHNDDHVEDIHSIEHHEDISNENCHNEGLEAARSLEDPHPRVRDFNPSRKRNEIATEAHDAEVAMAKRMARRAQHELTNATLNACN